jgi:hypothetical protein
VSYRVQRRAGTPSLRFGCSDQAETASCSMPLPPVSLPPQCLLLTVDTRFPILSTVANKGPGCLPPALIGCKAHSIS